MVAAQRVRSAWARVPALVRGITYAVGAAVTIFGAGAAFNNTLDAQRDLPATVQRLERATVDTAKAHRASIDSIRILLVPISCFTKANAGLEGYTRDGCALSPKP